MTKFPRSKRFLSVASICALCLCSAAIGAAERMTPGKWEFTMTTDGSTHAIEQCITA